MRHDPSIIKVVGTTFHPLPPGSLIKVIDTFDHDNIPSALTKVILMPEPDNQFDPNAVAVVVELEHGEAFTIGYIGKEDPWQSRITTPTLAMMRITDYATAGNYNASFNIVSIEDGR